MSKSPYEVLGIPPESSQDEIKKAHRALVNKYHPDRYINNPLVDLATERMQEINLAYRMLTNQQSVTEKQNRRTYKQQGFEVNYQEALRKKENGRSETDFKEAAVFFRSIITYKDSSLLAKECDDLAMKARLKTIRETYQKALQKKNNGKTENDFLEAAVLFRSIDGYEDSFLAKECDDLAKKAHRKEKRDTYH